MSHREVSLRKWVNDFEIALNDYNNGDTTKMQTISQNTWWDWFCKDTSLLKKTVKLGKMVRLLSKAPTLNLDATYVWFANHCPCSGSLYDTFTFSDMKTQEAIFFFVPKSGFDSDEGKAEIYTGHDWTAPIVSGTWIECRNFFLGKTTVNVDLTLVKA